MTDQVDAEAIAAKLSPTMQKAMIADRSRGCNSYSLRASLSTMEALNARKLVGRVGGVGAFYSPQTVIEWPLTSLGAAVRDVLMKEKG